ncbi:MAG TPA: response regulator [bacterium]
MERHRILLVDDEVGFANTLKTYLELTGRYTVRAVHRAEEALAVAEAFRPDLILLDVIMPDTDGGHLAADMREHEELKRVPIIFLTAAVSRQEAAAKEGVIGGQLFMAKPVTAREVMAKIDQYLKQPAAKSGAPAGAPPRRGSQWHRMHASGS